MHMNLSKMKRIPLENIARGKGPKFMQSMEKGARIGIKENWQNLHEKKQSQQQTTESG